MILPDRIKSFILSKRNRNLLLEKYGKKAFLLPDQLKFPVMDPKTGKYHCGLIYAARTRAKQFIGIKPGYIEIAKKAEELYKRNHCSQKINIHLKN